MLSKLRKKSVGLNREQGFTLIELMIVIAVIGILTAIALPKFASVKDNANLAQAKSEMKNIQTAMEMYYANNQKYPTYSNVNAIEGVKSLVVDKYKQGSSGSKYYNPGNDQETYNWTYKTKVGGTDYEITIDSTGTFKVEKK